MIHLNLHHLYYFYTVAKAGTIRQACEILHLAQPTISAQLKAFETMLGTPLFERRSQRLHLTEEGRRVLTYAEDIFQLSHELVNSFAQPPTNQPRVFRVGIQSGTPRSFAHALLTFILGNETTLRVIAREGPLEMLLSHLLEHRLDVILADQAAEDIPPDTFHNHLIGKLPLVFAVPPRLARRVRRVPQDLHHAPLILPLAPSQIYQQIRRYFLEHKISPTVVAEVDDIEVARRLAISGFGIVPMNRYMASVSQPKRALRFLTPPRSSQLYETVFLISRRRRLPHPIVEHLIRSFRLHP